MKTADHLFDGEEANNDIAAGTGLASHRPNACGTYSIRVDGSSQVAWPAEASHSHDGDARSMRTVEANRVIAMGIGDWVQIAIGVFAIAVSTIAFLLQRSRRSLGYGVLSDRPVLTSNVQFAIEVRFDGVAVEHPRQVVLRFVNSGNQPIEPSHFESPILFELSEASILSFEQTTSRPTTFRPTFLVADSATLQMQPCLINPRDMVEIQLLVDGADGEVTASSRVSGVKQIDRLKVSRTSWNEPWRMSLFDRVLIVSPSVGFGVIGLMLSSSNGFSGKIGGAIILAYALLVYPWQAWRTVRRNSLLLGE